MQNATHAAVRRRRGLARLGRPLACDARDIGTASTSHIGCVQPT